MAEVPTRGDIVDHYSDFESEYYKIKQLGDAGQFGTTYLATRTTKQEQQLVAVKIMEKRQFKEQGALVYREWIALQKTEVTALLVAHHPNIVRLLRVMEDEENVYLIMEYLGGGTLIDFMRSHKLSEQIVAHIVGQILSALDYMHERDILHLDLKPDNIVLADKNFENPTVKIIDFGLAAVLPRHQKLTGQAGTQFYMAPEVWGGSFDRSADLWATGVITFFLLFGFLPFYEENDGRDGVQRNSRAEIQRLVQEGFHNEVRVGHGPWFPADIPVSDAARNFVASLLQTDVRERYNAAEALIDPWLRGAATTDTLPDIVLREVSNFASALDRNRDLALLVSDPGVLQLSSVNSEESVQEFISQSAKNGKIDKASFVEQTAKLTNMRREEISQLFDHLDVDLDGYVSRDTVDRVARFNRLVAVDDRLEDLFHQLDTDGDGVLTEEDVTAALQNATPEIRQLLHIKKLFAVADRNGDGVIDKDEFFQAVHPDFSEPADSFTRSARWASEFASTLKTQSPLFYDMLRAMESEGLAGFDENVDDDEKQRTMRFMDVSSVAIELMDSVESLDMDAILRDVPRPGNAFIAKSFTAERDAVEEQIVTHFN